MRFSRFTGRMRHLLAGEPYDPLAPPPTRPVDALSGCALLIRREVLEQVGLLDEDFFFTFEDLELCLRARRAGYLSVCVGDAVAYHQGARSIGARSPARLYYATRNHLLAARRGSPLPFFLSIPRAKLIVGYNLVHALACGWVPAPRALALVARGTWDHARGRYGPMGG
jgi:GT2 family glycosyltransferase